MKISIIIPSYNSGKFIESTLQSIISQDYSDYECIVVDGGSTDNTLDIIDKYQGKVVCISEPDKGQSDAINKGLKIADGDIVTYLCADDVYEPYCFKTVTNFFINNPVAKWVYGKCTIIDENNQEVRRPITFYKNLLAKRYSYNALLISNFISQPATFWRRDLIYDLGLLDIKHHMVMDYEYWLRAGAKYKPGYINSQLARFRWHPVSKSATGFTKAAREALDVARKYALANKREYLAPLQYLNYFTVVTTYSVLKILAN